MSISHCVIRLEIADDCNFVTNIGFLSECRMAEAVENLASEKSDKRRPTSPPISPPVSSEDVKRFHGKRDLHEITVETYTREDIPESTDINFEREKSESEASTTEGRPLLDSISKVVSSNASTVTFGDFQPKEDIPSNQDTAATDRLFKGQKNKEDSTRESRRPSTSKRGRDDDGLSDGGSTLTSRDLPFLSGNPSVEVTKGIIHLFKENHTTPLDDDVPRSEMLCMLAVPASMTCHSLLQFLAPCGEGLQYVRIIRDTTPNQFMVLLKFVDQRAADEVYKEFNNQPFNSFEDSRCHLVYVASVECMKSNEGAFLPLPYHTELPTCHICLERMDESVDGILTILCNHTFHGSCLTKWGDTSCPICRHSQTPEQVEDNYCFECGSQESLWICLVCGHIGCGRYVETHAFRHFEETQHTYAMQLGNHRVWDYAGDNYVHRLVQNKADGKPVEMGGTVEQDEKMDSITLEFNYLLSSQLDSQRKYFEEKIARVEEDALVRVSEEETRSKKTLEERDRVEQQLQLLIKEKGLIEKRFASVNTKLKKITSELKEEREINRCLRENQKPWQEKVTTLETALQQIQETKDKEIEDLKEQLRDVMFYLEAQNTINQSPDGTRQEIQEGQIVMGATAGTPTGRSANRKGRKKGK